MPIWEAAVLGLVQGLAEFLPISSSGHLVVLHAWFGVEEGALTFDVMLHLATLAAIFIYFREDWIRLLRAALGALRHPDFSNPEVRLVLFLVLGTLPGALAGALFEHRVEESFHNSGSALVLVAATLAGMGLVLVLSEYLGKKERGLEGLTWVDALLIGLAQALALIPGVSRSGATMSAALFLGLRRAEAARFSFLLSAPIIAGAGLMKLPKVIAGAQGGEGLAATAVGFAVAAVSGYVAIRLLMRYVQSHSIAIFAAYRVAFAILIVARVISAG